MTDMKHLFDAVREIKGEALSQADVDKINAALAGPAPVAAAKPAITPKAAKTTLTALVGASAAAALLAGLTQFEGKRNVGYLDIAKIPTACMGDTKNVIVDKFYSDAECQQRLEAQALVHTVEVMRCTPSLRGRDAQTVAAGLLAYNIGATAYCKSTVDRRFDAGQWRAGCDAILAWDKARVGGKITVVRGLTNRREAERAICMKDL